MDIYAIRKQNLLSLMVGRTQRSCADRWDTSPSTLSQIVSKNPVRNLGDDLARKIEQAEGLPAGWFDHMHHGEPHQPSPEPARQGQAAEESEPRIPHEADYALIPQYTAKGGCGDGYLNGHVEVNGGLAFKRDWLARMRVKAENLYVIYAEGDSMEPYIFEGDVVLFDGSDIEPRDRQVYAIRRPDGGLSIKRIIQQLSGAWMIRSDNPDKVAYPDEPVSQAALHDMPILGRVIWRGGGIG